MQRLASFLLNKGLELINGDHRVGNIGMRIPKTKSDRIDYPDSLRTHIHADSSLLDAAPELMAALRQCFGLSEDDPNWKDKALIILAHNYVPAFKTAKSPGRPRDKKIKEIVELFESTQIERSKELKRRYTKDETAKYLAKEAQKVGADHPCHGLTPPTMVRRIHMYYQEQKQIQKQCDQKRQQAVAWEHDGFTYACQLADFQKLYSGESTPEDEAKLHASILADLLRQQGHPRYAIVSGPNSLSMDLKIIRALENGASYMRGFQITTWT